ncbi:hypothetical protein [Streptomyces sp. NPDC097640]
MHPPGERVAALRAKQDAERRAKSAVCAGRLAEKHSNHTVQQ